MWLYELGGLERRLKALEEREDSVAHFVPNGHCGFLKIGRYDEKMICRRESSIWQSIFLPHQQDGCVTELNGKACSRRLQSSRRLYGGRMISRIGGRIGWRGFAVAGLVALTSQGVGVGNAGGRVATHGRFAVLSAPLTLVVVPPVAHPGQYPLHVSTSAAVRAVLGGSFLLQMDGHTIGDGGGIPDGYPFTAPTGGGAHHVAVFAMPSAGPIDWGHPVAAGTVSVIAPPPVAPSRPANLPPCNHSRLPARVAIPSVSKGDHGLVSLRYHFVVGQCLVYHTVINSREFARDAAQRVSVSAERRSNLTAFSVLRVTPDGGADAGVQVRDATITTTISGRPRTVRESNGAPRTTVLTPRLGIEADDSLGVPLSFRPERSPSAPVGPRPSAFPSTQATIREARAQPSHSGGALSASSRTPRRASPSLTGRPIATSRARRAQAMGCRACI